MGWQVWQEAIPHDALDNSFRASQIPRDMKFIKFVPRWRASWWAAFFLPASFLCAKPATATEIYRGFTIDESRIENLTDLQAVRTAVKAQIDIVCAVGLPPEIMAFFQGVQLDVAPAAALNGNPGLYDRLNKCVLISTGIVEMGHKPVLLHEFMYAFHDQRLGEGFWNRTILSFYGQAMAISVFPAHSHMMSDQMAFFACSATTYLFGVTAQEPFKREKIKDNQPDFFAYLQKLFGPRAGSYAGSLAP